MSRREPTVFKPFPTVDAWLADLDRRVAVLEDILFKALQAAETKRHPVPPAEDRFVDDGQLDRQAER